MAKINIRIKGLPELKRNLKKAADIIQDEIGDEIGATAQAIASEATQNAPGDTGFLRGGVIAETKGGGTMMDWIVYAAAAYAAYVEFGTRTKVSVPEEMKDIANQFKNKKTGNWDEFKENIKAWVKRKGIVPTVNGKKAVNPDKYDWEELYFLIMMSIYKKGLAPRPFLYPAYKKETKGLDKRIDKRIQEELDKL